MTDAIDADMIRASWGRVSKHGREFVADFYGRLFDDHPELRPMFPRAMTGQHDKLLGGIDYVVVNIDVVQILVPWLHRLGRNHAKRYRVWRFHYDYVAEALLGALAKFDPLWNAAIKGNWAAAYTVAKDAMIWGAMHPPETIPGEVQQAVGTAHGNEQAVTSVSMRAVDFRRQTWRGFRIGDVREYLSLAIGEVGLLERRITELELELKTAKESLEDQVMGIKNSDVKGISQELQDEHRRRQL